MSKVTVHSWPVRASLLSGHETLEVVGESHYQEELWNIVGGHRTQPVRHDVIALLVPEPTNPHDSNAIQIQVGGFLVGYLSRADAAIYRPGLHDLIQRSDPPLIALSGVIVGGGPREDRIGYLGVFLDHDPADFGLHSQHVSHGGLRTGLTAASSDAGVGFDWHSQLPLDDAAASRTLRQLLESEHDAFRRHYLFSELEHRLYRARVASPGALEQFDSACAQHHREMNAIRPALIAKFGAVPVVEMYRQAAIRCQKARDWEAARDWANKGIEIYGTQAARPEVVDDLRHRVVYASGKLEKPSQSSSRPKSISVPSADGPTEALVCAECGAQWQRVRLRGRKPRLCPSCRGESAAGALVGGRLD